MTTPEYSRAYYLANRESILKYQRVRRITNAESVAEREKAYRERNKESRAAQKRAYGLRKTAERQERVRVYCEQNAEYLLATAESKQEAQRLSAIERSRQWRIDNPERASEKARNYARANPDRVAAIQGRRRARRSEGSDLTSDQWLDVIAQFDGHCAYCNRSDLPLVLEHMTPLARGGRHTVMNVVPACAPCNNRKYTKTALEFIGNICPSPPKSGSANV